MNDYKNNPHNKNQEKNDTPQKDSEMNPNETKPTTPHSK